MTIVLQRNGRTIQVPEATIGQLISMMEEQYRNDRELLLADLQSLNASDDSKLAALETLRNERGLTAKMARTAFTLEGAVGILKAVANPSDIDEVLDADKDALTFLALRVLGFQHEETKEEGEKEPTSP
tara:strand:+ start:227 stop:613 length:387 start_codon:yes stop_codon:yes gene_type:complete